MKYKRYVGGTMNDQEFIDEMTEDVADLLDQLQIANSFDDLEEMLLDVIGFKINIVLVEKTPVRKLDS